MLSGSDRDVDVPAIQILPWRLIIEKIDLSLLELSRKFLQAFGEGYFTKEHFETKSKETESLAYSHTYEYLKCALFHRVMHDMALKSSTFSNIKELDEFYIRYLHNFPNLIQEFLEERFNKRLIKDADLDTPISKRKLEMMEKIISLVHALDKVRFMLEQLDMQHSVRDCENKTITFYENAKIFANNIALIDCGNCQHRIIDPLTDLNHTLITIMKNKGYGEVKVEDLLENTENTTAKAAMFSGLYAELSHLPVLSDLKVLVDRLQKEKIKEASAELVARVKVIADIRQILRYATDKLLDESDKQLNLFAGQCESLTLLQNAIKEMKEIVAFFNAIESLRHYCHEILGPRCIEAGKEACGQTSNPLNKRWAEAQDYSLSSILALTEQVRAGCGQYEEAHEKYREACVVSEVRYNPLTQATALIDEWRTVNKQVADVADQCDELLGGTAKLSMSLAQTNEQFILTFLKRHWPELSIGVTVPSALTVGLTLTVLAVSPWITVPVAAVGVVGGLGVSLFRDRFFPPAVPLPKVSQDVAKVEEVVDTKHINQRLFGTTDDPVIVTEVRSNARETPAPAGISSWLAGFARLQGPNGLAATRQTTLREEANRQAVYLQEFEQTWNFNK
jgi:hypothetical protein